MFIRQQEVLVLFSPKTRHILRHMTHTAGVDGLPYGTNTATPQGSHTAWSNFSDAVQLAVLR